MSANSQPTSLCPLQMQENTPEKKGLNCRVPRIRLLLLLGVALVCMGLFLFYGLKGNIAYALNRRVLILATMLLVAFCAGVSTILFQTITHNRILSPAIMGFESLFLLVQATLLFIWGFHGLGFLTPVMKFSFEVFVMMVFSAAVYLWVFRSSSQNLFIVLLIGIVCGTFFGGMASLLQRLLSPDEFSIIQTRMFATFNIVPNTSLLLLSAGICLLALIIIWRIHQDIDVLTLGKNPAITLGVNYKLIIPLVLILTSALVAVSTALVGPLTFFGFLIANLTYVCIGSYKHRYMLPAATLLGVIALVGGQFILQHFLGMNTVLSVVINFIGGVMFIIILLRGASL